MHNFNFEINFIFIIIIVVNSNLTRIQRKELAQATVKEYIKSKNFCYQAIILEESPIKKKVFIIKDNSFYFKDSNYYYLKALLTIIKILSIKAIDFKTIIFKIVDLSDLISATTLSVKNELKELIVFVFRLIIITIIKDNFSHYFNIIANFLVNSSYNQGFSFTLNNTITINVLIIQDFYSYVKNLISLILIIITKYQDYYYSSNFLIVIFLLL
ncbi:hypothetical protein PPERSA_02055 [Pseudocohnilembus persalinus]|uniref:Uncharacterized protein n=1 Tax=Pseudocohnilembus persalinus TaxID=266149 RepID=A0A0V0QFC8_PSEPJ|nr:hypothetical protein PPERSA_02055 [Pseudocohnilembus persalinus]|eukprot:KRX00876.1 hypothetical protein PPERSA_02055 [Pseudocohnilembus persalinus]